MSMPTSASKSTRPKPGKNTSNISINMGRQASGDAAGPSRPKAIRQHGRKQNDPRENNQPRRGAGRGRVFAAAVQQDDSQIPPGDGERRKGNRDRQDTISSAFHSSAYGSGSGARNVNLDEAPTFPTQPPGGEWVAFALEDAAIISAALSNHSSQAEIPPITPNDLREIPGADEAVPPSSASIAQTRQQREKYVNPWATDSEDDNSDEPDEEPEETLRKIGDALLQAYNQGKLSKDELMAEAQKKIAAPIVNRARAHQFDRLFERSAPRPELLLKLRNGPGTDVTTDVYQELARPRLADGVEAPEPWSIQPPKVIPHAGYEEINLDENWRKMRKGTRDYHAQWYAYNKSPPVWPLVEDGKVTLTSTRPEGVLYEEQPFPHCLICSDDSELAPENRGPYSCRWWFGATVPLERIPFLERFYLWLNAIPEVNRYVNIYRKAFFDGTATPDGAFGMFIPKINHLQTPRNMQRKRTRIHWHETAAGYMHNMQILCRDEELAREEEIKREKEAFLAYRHLPVPKIVPSKVYLRPVEFHDAPGLLRLVNWYMENSPLSPETQPIDVADARQMVEDCRSNHLPFIVAVERRARATSKSSNAAEKVLGYAYLKYFTDGVSANRFTLEMRVYVDHAQKKKHIGRSLVDRILAMTDIMHHATAAHEFEPNDHNVSPEGVRYANVICAIAYPPDKASNYVWMKDWLMREFRFREQGTFRGARVKFDEALDVCFITRQGGSIPTTRNPRQYIS